MSEAPLRWVESNGAVPRVAPNKVRSEVGSQSGLYTNLSLFYLQLPGVKCGDF